MEGSPSRRPALPRERTARLPGLRSPRAGNEARGRRLRPGLPGADPRGPALPPPLRRQLACGGGGGGGAAGCARARGPGAAVGSAGNPRGPATGGRRGGSSGAGLQGAPRSRGRGLGRGGGAARPARKRSRPRVSGRSRGVWRLVLARRTGTALSRLSPASPLSCSAAGGGRELAGEVSSWPVGFACLLGALGGEESSSSLVHGRAGHRKVSYQLGDGGGPSASLLTGWDDLKVPEVSPASRAPGFPSSHPLSCSGGPWAGGRGDLAVPPPARWASRRHPRGLPALQLRSRRTVEPRSQRNRVRVLAGHRGVSIRPRASANTPEGRPGQEYPWNRTSDSGVSTSLSHFRSSPELGVVTVPRPDRYGPSNQGQRKAMLIRLLKAALGVQITVSKSLPGSVYGEKGSNGSSSFYYANCALSKIKRSLRKQSSALGPPEAAAYSREAASEGRKPQQGPGRGTLRLRKRDPPPQSKPF
ncbi:collagen alpha-1(I) chain-like [Balaenoptera musculus]|uniref:Collagen alpha-1(I) chain-like n=1 Tax=Balaenoptera musculus TaxID=9771 RepID=A0A8B8Z6F4_BALMU|nr:collagen alpha-1(I) chain-like [Balaenoptera musculus]